MVIKIEIYNIKQGLPSNLIIKILIALRLVFKNVNLKIFVIDVQINRINWLLYVFFLKKKHYWSYQLAIKNL
jgi:hypothetical protein